jgi:hypothetical protein
MAATAADENRGKRPREEAEATDENARNAFPSRHNTSPAFEFHKLAVIF